MPIKFCLVIPVYNVEQLLPRCLDSVLAQTYAHYEVILIDDGSPDASGKICDRYAEMDKRVSVIHQENMGLPGARNTGIKAATGDYVWFIDSDDYITQNALEILAREINQDYDALIFRFIRETSDGIKRTARREDLKNGTYLDDSIIRDIFLPGLGYSYHRRSSEHIAHSAWRTAYSLDSLITNGISFSNVRYIEDFIFYIDFHSCAGLVKVIDAPLYVYCENEESIVKSYKPGMADVTVVYLAKIEEQIQRYPRYASEISGILQYETVKSQINLILNQLRLVKRTRSAKDRDKLLELVEDSNFRQRFEWDYIFSQRGEMLILCLMIKFKLHRLLISFYSLK